MPGNLQRKAANVTSKVLTQVLVWVLTQQLAQGRSFPLLLKQMDYAAVAPPGFKMWKSERGRWLFNLVSLV